MPDDRVDSDANTKLGIFSKRKTKNQKLPKDLDSASDSNTDNSPNLANEKILEAMEVIEELGALGLEPAGLKKFTKSLHKLAVSSGVSPEILTSIIKEVNELCEGKKISLNQAHRYIGELASQKNAVLNEIEGLKKKKQSLEVNLSLKELESSTSKQRLSEYTDIKLQLEKHSLSFSDISRLVVMINNAAEHSYDSSKIVSLLANMQSQSDKKVQIEKEIENLLNSKQTLQERLLALDQDVSDRQKTIAAAEKLKKLGFDFKELERLQLTIKTMAQTRNIELAEAKDRLLSDLEGYYANDHELKKRIRILESLLEEKEEKFKLLGADYQNEKAILESAKKLISDGFDAQWLEKLQVLIGAYGMDIDLLSEELKQSQSLKNNINQLQRTKRALEEEEQLLRQKIVAVEDQRIRTLSLIKDMLTNSKSRLPTVRNSAETKSENEDMPILAELDDLVQGADRNGSLDERKFKIAAKKAISTIYSRLPKNSPTRLVLEHALLALKYEEEKEQ